MAVSNLQVLDNIIFHGILTNREETAGCCCSDDPVLSLPFKAPQSPCPSDTSPRTGTRDASFRSASALFPKQVFRP